MADSIILARLGVEGAVFTSAGEADAYKLPVLNALGKIDPSLIVNGAAIHQVDTLQSLNTLVAAPGDFAYVSSIGTLYVYVPTARGQNPTWLPLKSPVSSVNGYSGEVVLTKADLGLTNVDNTSDINKPISTAQQQAINRVNNQSIAYAIAL
jgi:hypothetical protein